MIGIFYAGFIIFINAELKYNLDLLNKQYPLKEQQKRGVIAIKFKVIPTIQF